jgi:catechol 2,3-dioxygenase-like lactoylglutathione lyase family enzyme
MTPTMDHAGLSMADYAAAKRFYAAALAPLGMRLTLEFPKEKTGDFDVGMFGEPGQQVLFIISGGGRTSPALHFAFRAENRAVVDAFHAAAMAAGGRDNGPPGIRAHYHKDYYAAFVLDPDGHNIEAVCHQPVPDRKATP